MKYILAFLLLAFSTSVTACNTQEVTTPAEPVKQEEKKKEPEVKRVCIWVYDVQQKKDVEKCRVTKIYEKKDGTPIPTK